MAIPSHNGTTFDIGCQGESKLHLQGQEQLRRFLETITLSEAAEIALAKDSGV